MKNRCIYLLYSIVLAIATGFISCSDDKDLGGTLNEIRTISTITIEQTMYNADEQNLYMLPNGEIQLSCTVLPEDADNKNVKWTSSNERVATVTADGYVVAREVGSTIIRVTPEIGFGPSDATPGCVLNVIEHYNYIETITINNVPDEPIAMTATYQVKAEAYPEDVTFKRYKWESLNPEIATIDDEGTITGVAPGVATIRAIADDLNPNPVSASFEVTVKPAVPIEDFEFTDDPELSMLGYGEEYQVQCTFTPADATAELLTWSSDNPDVISVDKFGKLQVHTTTGGSAVITATYGALSKSMTATVGEGRFWYSFGNGLGIWSLKSDNKSSVKSFDGDKTTVQMGGSKYRGDLVFVKNKKGQTRITPSVFRYLAVKISIASALSAGNNANGCIKLELWNDGTRLIGDNYQGSINNNNNSYTILGDGTFQTDKPNVIYYDLQSKYDKVTPTDWSQTFTLDQFKFVIADYEATDTYDIYWVRSFKTLEELQEFVNNENN
ncbi:Ig-like domain-containing protein [uncultured Bacteroides sp.]|uniref:Ig-like domain-containing protein n=1 Tax=uncultured Bacteroides sp. TaxID=162156 RepID=UPI00280AC63E|nr:Ig-like domain-containing protein [uncultured Bacteroides sp.]